LLKILLKTQQHHLDNGWSLKARDPEIIKAWMPIWEWFYQYYFRVQTQGWEQVPTEGRLLLVGSHNGGMASPDTSMFMYDWYKRLGYERPAYALMHHTAWKNPIFATLGAQVGALQAHPKMAIAALRQEAALLVYPGGAQDMFRPYSKRNEIYFAGRKGFIKLALREHTPILPLVSHGAHETMIMLTDLYPLLERLYDLGFPFRLDLDTGVFPIYIGLPWGLGVGPILNIPFPHPIHTKVCQPIIFERYGRQALRDHDYVNHCYELVCNHMQRELDELVAEVEGEA
jgi:1-acyl-sn-glycerol-3-phosphate acyltransferase